MNKSEWNFFLRILKITKSYNRFKKNIHYATQIDEFFKCYGILCTSEVFSYTDTKEKFQFWLNIHRIIICIHYFFTHKDEKMTAETYYNNVSMPIDRIDFLKIVSDFKYDMNKYYNKQK